MYTYERQHPSAGRADFVPVGWSGRKIEIFEVNEFPWRGDHEVIDPKGEDNFVEIAVPVFSDESVRRVIANFNRTTPDRIDII